MAAAGSAAARPGGAPPVLWSVVEESLDEADFLWRRREAALAAHDQTPAGVEFRIEERLLGAIEGLCVPGDAAVDRLLAPALEAGEPSMVAVAAQALAVGETAAGIDCLTAAFLRASGARLQALRRGLELTPLAGPYLRLAASTNDAPDAVRAAFLEACAFRGLPLEPRLGERLTSASPELQRAAARLLRHAPPAMRSEWLPHALELVDRRAREAAVETALIVGARSAWGACRELAVADINPSGAMLLPLAMVGTAHDHQLALAALAQGARRREALWAIGFGGRRAGADACVDLLAQEVDAREVRLAAESFCAITGLDLRDAGLAASAPASESDEPPAFEDEDLDADLVPREEDRLPVPDVSGLIRWWNRNRSRFDADARYLRGCPVGVGPLVDALAKGPMRRRRPLAFELAVRTQGRVQLETGALIADQRRCLATTGAASSAGAIGRRASETSVGARR